MDWDMLLVTGGSSDLHVDSPTRPDLAGSNAAQAVTLPRTKAAVSVSPGELDKVVGQANSLA